MTEAQTESVNTAVADAGFLEGHLELHHYTSFEGLSGIFKSNTIWATHFTDLNDFTEVILFREPLTAALSVRFKELIRTRQRGDPKFLLAVFKHGGVNAVAADLARGLANSLYKVTFEGGGSFEFCKTYIASFCSHSDQGYENEHGLLSQWRGYGKDGGFCVVFDTSELAQLSAHELNQNYYVHLQIAPVHYALDGTSVAQLFPALFDCCEVVLTEVLDGNMKPSARDAFVPFVGGATLYKHQGFREEREVRIVAMPGSQELVERIKAEHAEFVPKPCKDVDVLENADGKRSHISLFQNLKATLPIKRVIVGPSRKQSENVDRARALLGDDFSVIKSATPFLG